MTDYPKLSSFRGLDANSLYRVFDRANAERRDAPTLGQRASAERATRLAANELRRRGLGY
jgi:hypothetical protein